MFEHFAAINLRRQKQNGGHCSAETLLLGGKFINFASLVSSYNRDQLNINQMTPERGDIRVL